ncbi:MAG: 50S ribosomal protein L17 [Candidatus Vogelbacteria bacterium CG10_big_fil_rev_8_21_14_0_10_51_16]|uniref:Large ribosomal subunit protein bL17 n=1 Tax=Candidatus Vogelbacteria bacterium CG10_big_fil_rev_8_21_14_0_10_51_16 TaxID=1975045 RepID=A0A2H0RE55_9BACT|nr:MAG: 50S ribosomal protein L17 [Candidatus Vogelbacteria bacterium CG10_big_fil_rev_8_21_14_0_10_51_16]
MRHHNANRKFGRPANQRLALLRSLAEGLLKNRKIKTTEAKAKELRPYVEKLITISKRDTVASRRLLASRLGTVARMQLLMKKVAPDYRERAGGYTRIIKLNPRLSDASPMAIIELV